MTLRINCETVVFLLMRVRAKDSPAEESVRNTPLVAWIHLMGSCVTRDTVFIAPLRPTGDTFWSMQSGSTELYNLMIANNDNDKVD